MVVVTLINRLRSTQSLSLLMTSVVMGNKMGVRNGLSHRGGCSRCSHREPDATDEGEVRRRDEIFTRGVKN